MMTPFAERAKKVPVSIRILIILPTIVLWIYWMVSNTGVYYWLAEFQANNLLDGEHYLFVSAIGSLIVLLIPAAFMVQSLGMYYEKQEQEESQGQNGDDTQNNF